MSEILHYERLYYERLILDQQKQIQKLQEETSALRAVVVISEREYRSTIDGLLKSKVELEFAVKGEAARADKIQRELDYTKKRVEFWCEARGKVLRKRDEAVKELDERTKSAEGWRRLYYKVIEEKFQLTQLGYRKECGCDETTYRDQCNRNPRIDAMLEESQRYEQRENMNRNVDMQKSTNETLPRGPLC